MNEIQLIRLNEIPISQILDLMNNEKVAAYLPLLSEGFSGEDCQAFLEAKNQLWEEHGYGPWGFLIKGEFAGWGGLQEEQGDADFALVLHPEFWGWGLKIFKLILDQAFNEMGLNSITILLPPNRPNSKAVARLGFIHDGQLLVHGETFLRFRLNKPSV